MIAEFPSGSDIQGFVYINIGSHIKALSSKNMLLYPHLVKPMWSLRCLKYFFFFVINKSENHERKKQIEQL